MVGVYISEWFHFIHYPMGNGVKKYFLKRVTLVPSPERWFTHRQGVREGFSRLKQQREGQSMWERHETVCQRNGKESAFILALYWDMCGHHKQGKFIKTYSMKYLKENEILRPDWDMSWRTLNVILMKPDYSQWWAHFFVHKENIMMWRKMF